MLEPRINIITVAVDDLTRSFDFIRDVFGWQAWWPADGDISSADHAAFELQTGLSFVLYPRAALAQDARSSSSARSSAEFILSHFVDSKEAVDKILDRAEAVGATLIRRPDVQTEDYTGEFKDLDGNMWQIMWSGDAAGEV